MSCDQISIFHSKRHCVPWVCHSMPAWVSKPTVAAGLWNLEVSVKSGGFETKNPTVEELWDLSDCEKVDSLEKRTCEVRCRGPTYKGSTTLRCDRSGQLIGDEPQCVVDYARTEPHATANGPIQGVQRPVGCSGAECVDTFFQVPYAAPPTGANRFRPPQPVDGWAAVKALPSGPHQGCLGWTGTVGTLSGGGTVGSEADEDCLYLDVYVPRGVEGPLPVLFHIFAGGFVGGDNWGAGAFDGAGTAQANKAIVVAPNFRIGLLGHMGMTALRDSDPDRTTGNYGLQDQRAAMQWVQSNIAAFGGDPARVVLFGTSSGAFSVHFHRLSPASAPLFSAGIMQGSVHESEWWYQPLEEADKFYSVLSAEAGCPTEGQSAAQVRSCLQELSVPELFRATTRNNATTVFLNKGQLVNMALSHLVSNGVFGTDGTASFTPAQLRALGRRVPMLANPGFPALPCGPVVDGSSLGLPAAPRELIAQGKTAATPAVAITARDEGSMFLPLIGGAYPYGKLGYPMVQHEVESLASWWFASHNNTVLNDLYPRSAFPSPDQRGEQIITDGIFRCSNRKSGHASHKWGRSNYYVVEWHTSTPSVLRRLLGDFHADGFGQFWYYSHSSGFWPTEDIAKHHAQVQLAAWANCMMASLAHCGDPNGCPGLKTHSCTQAEALRVGRTVETMRPFGEADERLVVSAVEEDTPQEHALGRYETYPQVVQKRCAVWDDMSFPFLRTYYNEGEATLRGDCVGHTAIEGSSHWVFCDDNQHSCHGQCCCNFGFRLTQGKCAKCTQAEVDVQTQGPPSSPDVATMATQLLALPAVQRDDGDQDVPAAHNTASAGTYGSKYRRSANRGRMSLQKDE